MNNNFAMKLRTANVNLHKATEITGFNSRLVMGKATKETYGEFMFNYFYIYEAIENALDKLSNVEEVKPFVTKELYRSELIKKDLEFIFGDKLASMEVIPSTKAYVARINEIANSNTPILIVAHAYTRFLADLFGGRTIHNIVKENYIKEEEGLNYFKFDKIQNIMEYVKGYRDNLTHMSLDSKTEELFLNEVANSYLYNLGVSAELEVKLFNGEEVGMANPAVGHGHGKMPAGHPPVGHGHGKMPEGHPQV